MPLNQKGAPSVTPTPIPAVHHEPSKTPTTIREFLPNANGIIRQDQSKRELAAYYAATAFNMRPSTIIRAINNTYLDSWPGLTSLLITKNLIKSTASAKGHLDQEKKNLQSTQTDITLEMEEIPIQETDNSKTNNICAALLLRTMMSS